MLELKDNSLEFKESQIKNFICHGGEIDNFALSHNYEFLATCSQGGAYIKVFDARNGG